jgi:hypothetical protein
MHIMNIDMFKNLGIFLNPLIFSAKNPTQRFLWPKVSNKKSMQSAYHF